MKHRYFVGDKKYMLLIVDVVGLNKYQMRMFLCKCDCGNFTTISSGAFIKNKSCGCLKKNSPARTHGKSKNDATYRSWLSMRSRCSNPKNNEYKNYGARGISVCERWMKFENFLADMGNRPLGKTIGRIKNHLGYYKKNCEWQDAKTQMRNTRSNIVISFKGEAHCIAEWADIVGLSPFIIYGRIRDGWEPERALTERPRLTSLTPKNSPNRSFVPV